MSLPPSTPAKADSRPVSGWVEAFLYVLCVALLSVTYATGASHGAHTVVFILYSVVISGCTLLAVTGPGANWRAIVLHPASWLVGVTNIIVEGAFALMVGYIAPAEASLLNRASIPLTLLIGVVAFRRRPPPLVWLGAALVTGVVGVLFWHIDRHDLAPVFACTLAGGLTVGIRAFATELHTWNRAARSLTEKVQVTALVSLVTAIAGLATVGVLMAAVASGLLRPTPLLPSPAALVHPSTIVLALIVGGALFTAMTYLSFSSLVKIRSENFIATGAFIPLAALSTQYPAAALGLIALPPFDWRLLPAMLAAIAGVLLMIWGNRRSP